VAIIADILPVTLLLPVSTYIVWHGGMSGPWPERCAWEIDFKRGGGRGRTGKILL